MSLLREFWVACACEITVTGFSAILISASGWIMASMSDFLVRVCIAYGNLGGIVNPAFACAMVCSGDLRAEHCFLIVVVDIFAVLLGRLLLLCVLPYESLAFLVPSMHLASREHSSATGWVLKSRLFYAPFGMCPQVATPFASSLDVGRTHELLRAEVESVSFALTIHGMCEHFVEAVALCIFIFNSLAWLGRYAGVTLAAIGTTLSYRFGFVNPAWGIIQSWLECQGHPRHFVCCGLGAVLGGSVAGTLQFYYFTSWSCAAVSRKRSDPAPAELGCRGETSSCSESEEDDSSRELRRAVSFAS